MADQSWSRLFGFSSTPHDFTYRTLLASMADPVNNDLEDHAEGRCVTPTTGDRPPLSKSNQNTYSQIPALYGSGSRPCPSNPTALRKHRSYPTSQLHQQQQHRYHFLQQQQQQHQQEQQEQGRERQHRWGQRMLFGGDETRVPSKALYGLEGGRHQKSAVLPSGRRSQRRHLSLFRSRSETLDQVSLHGTNGAGGTAGPDEHDAEEFTSPISPTSPARPSARLRRPHLPLLKVGRAVVSDSALQGPPASEGERGADADGFIDRPEATTPDSQAPSRLRMQQRWHLPLRRLRGSRTDPTPLLGAGLSDSSAHSSTSPSPSPSSPRSTAQSVSTSSADLNDLLVFQHAQASSFMMSATLNGGGGGGESPMLSPLSSPRLGDRAPPLGKLKSRRSAPEPTLPHVDYWDYDSLDAKDPAVEISWLRSFPLFGFSPRDPNDPRYKALAKLKSVMAQHGIDDLRWPDYLLALSVYTTMADRTAKRALRSPSFPLSSLLSSTSSSNSFSSSSTPRAPYRSQALPSLHHPRVRVPRLRHRSASFHTLPPGSPPSWSQCSTPPASPLETSPHTSIDSAQMVHQAASTDDENMIHCHFPNDEPSNRGPRERCHKGASNELVRRARSYVEHGSHYKHFHHLKRDLTSESLTMPALFNRRWSLPDDALSSSRAAMAIVKETRIQGGHIQLLYHMLRHAESIYGLPLTVASAPRISFTHLTDRAIVCRRTGVAPQDLIKAEFTAQPFLPAFYVAVDRRMRAIVVCVRGTANFIDSLTDMAATQDPMRVRHIPVDSGSPVLSPVTSASGSASGSIMTPSTSTLLANGLFLDDEMQTHVDGFGHAGVLRSARNLLTKVRGDVIRAVQENPEYAVLTTGHSLGAATASVLALLMRDDGDCPGALSVSFAPPPCLTYELAEQTAALGITVVNGPDIVPRLSVAVMLPLFATARYVADLPRAKKSLLTVGVRHGVIDWDELEHIIAQRMEHMEKLHDGKRLFIPGRVHQLVRRGEAHRVQRVRNVALRKREVDVFHVSRTKFLQVRARERGMFFAHAPFSYRGSLSLALRSMGQTPTSVSDVGNVMTHLAGGQNFKQVWSQLCQG